MAGEKQAYTYGSVGTPEDLNPVIENISPKTTPIYTMAGKGNKVTAANHEWLVDSLAAPAANAVVEGADVTALDPDTPTRLGNYVQQFDKPYFVTDIQQALADASGSNAADIDRIREKKMREIARDVEYAIVNNDTKVASAASTAPKFGGLPYWIATGNYATANVRTVSGAFVESGTNGFLEMVQDVWADHEYEKLTAVMSGANKKIFSQFTGSAVKNNDAKTGEIYGAVDIYHSDFGDIVAVASRYMPDTDVYALDMEYVKKSSLIPFHEEELGKTGHKVRKVITGALTIENRAIECHGRLTSIS